MCPRWSLICSSHDECSRLWKAELPAHRTSVLVAIIASFAARASHHANRARCMSNSLQRLVTYGSHVSPATGVLRASTCRKIHQNKPALRPYLQRTLSCSRRYHNCKYVDERSRNYQLPTTKYAILSANLPCSGISHY